MGIKEIRTALKVDLDKPASQQPGLHVSSVHQSPESIIADPLRTDGTQIVCRSTFMDPNALLILEPPVPAHGKIANNEVVKIECLDWTGGQIKNNDSADDVKNVDLTKIHYLSGPFDIETAEPGDILLVEIQDVQPFPDQPWGFTGVFDRQNGGGFLDEIYPEAYV